MFPRILWAARSRSRPPAWTAALLTTTIHALPRCRATPSAVQESMGTIHLGIEYVALGIEAVAITIIVAAVIRGTFSYVRDFLRRPVAPGAYTRYKESLGLGLLLGLEVLIAADVIRTIALEPSFASIGVLGLLVVVRTFLSWSIVVEIEGRWPWEQGKQQGHGQRSDAP